MKLKLFVSVFLLLGSLALSAQDFSSHPWKDAKVAFIGDSITDPYIEQENHDWTGKDNFHYWGCLQKYLGIKPYVYGVSGRMWDDVVNQANQLKSEHGDDFDAITIFLGTNDFIGDVPLGEWYETSLKTAVRALGYPAVEAKRPSRTPVMDLSTLRGRINVAMSTLKRMFPEKQIVILTPVHRAYATFGEQNIQPDESFPNRLGLYFLDYVEAIREAGNVWGVPVIDLNSVCGINPMVEEQVIYFSDSETDRLHPNAKGHERIARTLLYQLFSLPCRF